MQTTNLIHRPPTKVSRACVLKNLERAMKVLSSLAVPPLEEGTIEDRRETAA